MNIMNKADWQEIEEKLIYNYEKVKLECDGFNVELRRMPYKHNDLLRQDAIFVLIDGKLIPTQKAANDCEEGRRFCCPRKHKMPLGDLGLTLAKYSKMRKRDREIVDKTRTFTAYYPWWTSFKSMRQHFEKNNKHISVIREEEE